MKLKWKVGEKPSGTYRSFFKRGWPGATYSDGDVAVQLYAENGKGYHPQDAETTVLVVHVADYHDHTFTWRRLKARPVGVKAAKELAREFIDKYGGRLRDRSTKL